MSKNQDLPPIIIFQEKGFWGCRIYTPALCTVVFPCRSAADALIASLYIIQDEIL